MKFIINIFLFLCFPLILMAHDKQCRAEYLPDIPVVYTIKINALQNKALILQNKVKFILTRTRQDGVVNTFPCNLNLVLTAFTQKCPISKKLNYTAKVPYSPISFTLINPYQIAENYVGNKFQEKLAQIIDSQYSQNAQLYICDVVGSLFSLPENEIYVGKELNYIFSDLNSHNQLRDILRERLSDHVTEQIKSEITEINDHEIKAKFSYVVSMVLDEDFIRYLKSLDDVNVDIDESIKSLKIQVQGKGHMAWNRKNAMLFQRESDMFISTKIVQKSAEYDIFENKPTTLEIKARVISSIDSKLQE